MPPAHDPQPINSEEEGRCYPDRPQFLLWKVLNGSVPNVENSHCGMFLLWDVLTVWKVLAVAPSPGKHGKRHGLNNRMLVLG
jgi:hypothetical protein